MFKKKKFKIQIKLTGLVGFLMLGIVSLPVLVAADSSKKIPSKAIPHKHIPKTRRYYQAPAFNKRAKKNRRLVIKSRSEKRQLRRTGSAYGDDFR